MHLPRERLIWILNSQRTALGVERTEWKTLKINNVADSRKQGCEYEKEKNYNGSQFARLNLKITEKHNSEKCGKHENKTRQFLRREPSQKIR